MYNVYADMKDNVGLISSCYSCYWGIIPLLLLCELHTQNNAAKGDLALARGDYKASNVALLLSIRVSIEVTRRYSERQYSHSKLTMWEATGQMLQQLTFLWTFEQRQWWLNKSSQTRLWSHCLISLLSLHTSLVPVLEMGNRYRCSLLLWKNSRCVEWASAFRL